MNWTTEKPTKPGWYWARWKPHSLVKDYTHDQTPFVVRVTEWGTAMEVGDEGDFSLGVLGQFAGPIPEPTEDRTKLPRHTVDAIKFMGFELSPEVETQLRAICDEQVNEDGSPTQATPI